jgi:hypothetical protein
MPQEHLNREPSSGPIRNRNEKGLRKAEAPKPNHLKHESSWTTPFGGSTGIDPGHAWTGAIDKTGGGKVWRTPSKNPSMIDRNLT